jgi:hypothetical protein
MFSGDYRRAVSAEAAGDYSEAARAYALCGENAKVAEMHLLRAERAPSSEARLGELKAAIRWADTESPEGIAARRRIARALYRWAKTGGVLSEADRQVVREAAALFESSGDPSGAGECFELIGDDSAAAEAYQRAGDVERLESVLGRDESRRRKERRASDAHDEYRLRLESGERGLALIALRQCVEDARGAEKASFRRELDELLARRLSDGFVALRARDRERRYAGRFPLVIGREVGCQFVLRDAGISRQHSEIVRVDAGFVVRDLGSRNGTLLAGMRVEGALPLAGAGELGIGDQCALAFSVEGERLSLTVRRGLDRGLELLASFAPIPLLEAAELRFIEGAPVLRAVKGRALWLNGRPAAPDVELLRGDVVELRHANHAALAATQEVAAPLPLAATQQADAADLRSVERVEVL